MVREFAREGSVARLEIEATLTRKGSELGASVAINGACLTVAALTPGGFVFDLGPETLARTALASLGPGQPVNLERPLRMGGALGGISSSATWTAWPPWKC